MKPKKVHLASETPKVEPRELQAINEEFSKLCAEAGETGYNLKVLQYKVDKINLRISQLVEEGSARAQLDKHKEPTKEGA